MVNKGDHKGVGLGGLTTPIMGGVQYTPLKSTPPYPPPTLATNQASIPYPKPLKHSNKKEED